MTREQILDLDGPELDKQIALAMGMEFELIPAQIHMDWVDVVFIDSNLFIPHRDMNDVRKMWKYIFDQGNRLVEIFLYHLRDMLYTQAALT